MSLVKREHVEQYAEEGCVRVPGVFDARWIDRLTEAVLRIWDVFRDGHVPRIVWPNATQNPPTIHASEGGVQLRNCMHCDPALHDWLLHSPAAEVVGEIMQAENVRYWMDATFIKEGDAPGSATPWHNDGCTFAFVGEQLPSFWVALTDVAEDNAPMLTLAGSNRDPWRYHSPLSRQDIGLLPGYRPWQELLDRVAAPDASVRVWPAKAGDILLIHPKTIHASRARTTREPGRRIALTTRWIGSDVVWSPDAFSAHIPALTENPAMIRGEPPPESLFPVLWRRR